MLGIITRDAHTTTRADTVGLVRVLYAALTGHWTPDPSLPSFDVDLPVAPTVDDLPPMKFLCDALLHSRSARAD